jgi:hypothetical protein
VHAAGRVAGGRAGRNQYPRLRCSTTTLEKSSAVKTAHREKTTNTHGKVRVVCDLHVCTFVFPFHYIPDAPASLYEPVCLAPGRAFLCPAARSPRKNHQFSRRQSQVDYVSAWISRCRKFYSMRRAQNIFTRHRRSLFFSHKTERGVFFYRTAEFGRFSLDIKTK